MGVAAPDGDALGTAVTGAAAAGVATLGAAAVGAGAVGCAAGCAQPVLNTNKAIRKELIMYTSRLFLINTYHLPIKDAPILHPSIARWQATSNSKR